MDKTTDLPKFGIKPKLFLLVLITIGSIVAVISWQINSQSKITAEKAVKQALLQSETILKTKIDSRFKSINETVTSLTRDGRILPLIYDGESATLQDLTAEFEKALDFNSMLVLDAQGYVLARSDRSELIGYSMAGRSYLFDQPLQGKTAQGFVVSSGVIMQMVVLPVFDNVAKDIVRGVIALSYELSFEMAQDINALTASDINFYAFTYDKDRNIIGVNNTHSTRPDLQLALDNHFSNKANWQPYTQLKTADKGLMFTLGEQTYRAVVKPIPRTDSTNLGFILAFKSETELLKPFLEIEKTVFLVGSICLIIALIAAWLMARQISNPIISLVNMTRDIDNGEAPQQPQKNRRDEIGILNNALYAMGKSLRDKAELESYLADVAEDFSQQLGGLDSELIIPRVDDQPPLSTPQSITTKPDSNTSDFDANATMVVPDIGASQSRIQQQIIAGRYEVRKTLGQGATGLVFQAFDKDLDELVAVKVLSNEYVTSEFAQRFKEEIKLARKITHRNILRTFDFGSADDIYYITMEYVQGYDLGKLVDRKGGLSPHITVILARQICSALAAAHELGIIHRDLKPENMMINQRGILKIMDFGLAMEIKPQQVANAIGDGGANETTVAGTPKYMAPEQFSAGELDQRTDIYAVGIILYTLLAGKTPFNAKDIDSLALMHFKETAADLATIVESVPTELVTIINKAMEKHQDDRYQSVADMLKDLTSLEV
jgi:serine/threonine-protein kinase